MKPVDIKGTSRKGIRLRMGMQRFGFCKPRLLVQRADTYSSKQILRNQSGLTAIQILVGVIVLGIIAAVLLAPRLLGQAGRALQAQAAEEIETLGIALDRYAKDNGDYPSTEQGLKALWENPEEPPIPIKWSGPYMQIPITLDPWGNPYIYIRPGAHDRYGYDLISFGRDGLEGGTGEAEDVVSWIRRDE